ncbi:MAG: aspartate/glutamate racemase family protein [Eubacteriales bacterium]|jgi:aspartate racemase
MEAKAKKMLGVIGGMGPQATQLFMQGVLDKTDASCDQEHIPMLIYNHTTMPDRTACILSGREDEVFALLEQDAQMLERAGCQAIAIPCNTSHYFADRLQKSIGIPLINMVRETVEYVAFHNKGIRRLAVLATDGTVRTGVYQRECEKFGIQCYTPTPQTQQLVMDIIYKEIKQGKLGSYATFVRIDRELKAAGCEAAILACTELSCFKEQHRLSNFYIDAMDVLVDRCVAFCEGRED